MSSFSLRELVGDYQRLKDMMNDPDIDEEVIKDSLESIQGNFEVKVQNCCYIAEDYNDILDAIKKQEEKLDAYKQHVKKRKTWLEEYVMYCMEQTGNKTIYTDSGKISVVNNGGKQPIEIKGDVPNEYMRKTVTFETDKEKIRKDLELGVALDFAELKPRGKHLKY